MKRLLDTDRKRIIKERERERERELFKKREKEATN